MSAVAEVKGSEVDGVAGWSLGGEGLEVWLWLEERKRRRKREGGGGEKGVMRIWRERKMGE